MVKVTHLFREKGVHHGLQQPLDYGYIDYARATTLAWHLNQEVALLTEMCQHSAAASPAVHLEQDVHYNLLRSAH